MSDGVTREGRRFVAEDAATVAIATVGLILCLRARANYVPCALIPFALPVILVAFSRDNRHRLIEAARARWKDLDDYARGGRTPWRAVSSFVMIPALLVFLANDHFDLSLDSCPVVPTAISLVTEGNTDLDEFYRDIRWWRETQGVTTEGLPYFLKRSGGRLYSTYPAGMVPLALPVVGLARIAGANLKEPNVQTRLEKLTASIIAAVALGVFFLIALHLVCPAPALVTTAILAFASGMATTVSQNLWQHDGVILGSLVILLIEFRGPGRWGSLAQGVICGTLPACRVTSVAFLVPFGVWILWKSPARALRIVGVAALAAGPWVAYYLSVYGSPFGPSSSQMQRTLWSAELGRPLVGVLVSPGRGLLTYQPWLILALLGFLPSVRKVGARVPLGWEWVCIAAMVILVGVVAAWQCWYGGFCWGSRLVMEIVPLGALLCLRPIAALGMSRGGRGLIATLVMLGMLMHLPSLYLGAYRWNVVYAATQAEAVWSWSHAPFLAPINLPRP